MKIITGGISNKKRALIVLTVFALLGSLLALTTAAYQNSRRRGGDKGGYLYQIYAESQSGTNSAPTEETTTRQTVLVLGKDYDSNRTDAIICVSFDYEGGGVASLQIPRDTYVKDGDYVGRINGLLPRYRAQALENGVEDATDTGIKALMKKIDTDFGIHCDNYVFLDSTAVEQLTNAMGGVTLDIPMDIDYTDTSRGIDLHLKAGKQRLNGAQAAQFVRYRQGYPQADIGRINAQKLFAAAMLEKFRGFSSVSNAAKMVDALSACVKTDLTANDITRMATHVCLAKPDKVVMYNMPGDGVTVNGGSYYGVFTDKLAEILQKGFGGNVAVSTLKAESFNYKEGGYRDTEGVKLSTVLEDGIAIPVYAD